MTHTHYVAIANLLARYRPDADFIAALVDYFASDNPNFDRARFLAACEPSTMRQIALAELYK